MALFFAVLMLAATPGLAGHAHHMHAHDAIGVSAKHNAQSDAGTASSVPIAATCMQAGAGMTAATSAAAPDEYRYHPCDSHDAGCKRISSCVSCVSAITSTFEAMPVPYAVRALRKAPAAMILAGVPPGKLQRPPRRPS